MRHFRYFIFLIVFACSSELVKDLPDAELGEDLPDAELGEDLPDAELEEDLPDAELGEDLLDPELAITLDIDAWDKGGYPNEGPYVTIAYENSEHKSSILSASRIALLAHILIDVWDERELPNLDAVKQRFSRFHLFALASDDTYARFKFPDLYAENPNKAIDKLSDSGAFCFSHGNDRYTDVPENSQFFIVIKGEFLKQEWGKETVLHEMVHAALDAGYGDSDSDHARSDFWLPRSGIDNGSFMAEILKIFP
jgi:hypothetical protein